MQKNGWSGTATLLMALSAFGVSPAYAAQYLIPSNGDAVVGEDQTIETVYEDTLYDLARKLQPGLRGTDSRQSRGRSLAARCRQEGHRAGAAYSAAGPREGIVVNLPEHRLYYYPKPKHGDPREVITYPVSIGKMDWRTPLGLTHVIAKQKDPTLVSAGIGAQGARCGRRSAAGDGAAGAQKSAGRYAMRLAAGKGTYLIHGTNNPIAVGLAGNARLHPHVSGGRGRAVSVDSRRNAGAPDQRAGQGGLGRRRAAARSASAGRCAGTELSSPISISSPSCCRRQSATARVAIHWDYAREVLQKADGVIATVGLQADMTAVLDVRKGVTDVAK